MLIGFAWSEVASLWLGYAGLEARRTRPRPRPSPREPLRRRTCGCVFDVGPMVGSWGARRHDSTLFGLSTRSATAALDPRPHGQGARPRRAPDRHAQDRSWLLLDRRSRRRSVQRSARSARRQGSEGRAITTSCHSALSLESPTMVAMGESTRLDALRQMKNSRERPLLGRPQLRGALLDPQVERHAGELADRSAVLDGAIGTAHAQKRHGEDGITIVTGRRRRHRRRRLRDVPSSGARAKDSRAAAPHDRHEQPVRASRRRSSRTARRRSSIADRDGKRVRDPHRGSSTATIPRSSPTLALKEGDGRTFARSGSPILIEALVSRLHGHSSASRRELRQGRGRLPRATSRQKLEAMRKFLTAAKRRWTRCDAKYNSRAPDRDGEEGARPSPFPRPTRSESTPTMVSTCSRKPFTWRLGRETRRWRPWLQAIRHGPPRTREHEARRDGHLRRGRRAAARRRLHVRRRGSRRRWNTPLDERGIIGTAIGIAMAGGRPIAEIQFCDYIYNTIDLLKVAGSTSWSSHGDWNLPMIVMTPVGSGIRGSLYHSHSFDASATHLPGWKTVMPSTPLDAYGLLLSACKETNPVFFLVPKALMRVKGDEPIPGAPADDRALSKLIDAPLGDRTGWSAQWPSLEDPMIPLGKAKIVREGSRVTVVSYGRTLGLCVRGGEGERRRRRGHRPAHAVAVRLGRDQGERREDRPRAVRERGTPRSRTSASTSCAAPPTSSSTTCSRHPRSSRASSSPASASATSSRWPRSRSARTSSARCTS